MSFDPYPEDGNGAVLAILCALLVFVISCFALLIYNLLS